METYTYHGKTIDLTASEVRLDIVSPLEIGLILLVILGVISTIAFPFLPIPMYWTLIPFFVTVFSVVVYKKTDCTYLIDNMRKSIDYSRTIFSSETRYTVCRFDQIHCIAVNGTYISNKQRSHWAYDVAVITDTGTTIRVTDKFHYGLEKANTIGEMLAEHFEAEFVIGQTQKMVKVTYDRSAATVKVTQEPFKPNYRLILWIFITMAFVTAVTTITILYFTIK